MGPEFDFIKNGRAGSSETAVPVTVLIPGWSRRPYIVQDGGLSYRRKFFQAIAVGNARTGGDLTWILQTEVILCARTYVKILTIGANP